MIIMRFIEDAYIVGRFAYFYAKAPEMTAQVGFSSTRDAMTVRDRAKFAWTATVMPMQRGH